MEESLVNLVFIKDGGCRIEDDPRLNFVEERFESVDFRNTARVVRHTSNAWVIWIANQGRDRAVGFVDKHRDNLVTRKSQPPTTRTEPSGSDAIIVASKVAREKCETRCTGTVHLRAEGNYERVEK